MFESAELGHKIDKDTYDKEVPPLREALQRRHLLVVSVLVYLVAEFCRFKHGDLLIEIPV